MGVEEAEKFERRMGAGRHRLKQRHTGVGTGTRRPVTRSVRATSAGRAKLLLSHACGDVGMWEREKLLLSRVGARGLQRANRRL